MAVQVRDRDCAMTEIGAEPTLCGQKLPFRFALEASGKQTFQLSSTEGTKREHTPPRATIA